MPTIRPSDKALDQGVPHSGKRLYCRCEIPPDPEQLIAPMRGELTRHGVKEARTPTDVDRLLAGGGTLLMIVNSVCGCAAGRARPAVGLALQHPARPTTVATVFAGGDEAAVAHMRDLLADYPPSSASIAIFQGGKPTYMIHRSDFERREPEEIAQATHRCVRPVLLNAVFCGSSKDGLVVSDSQILPPG